MFDKCDMFWVGGASANVLVATILHKTFNADEQTCVFDTDDNIVYVGDGG